MSRNRRLGLLLAAAALAPTLASALDYAVSPASGTHRVGRNAYVQILDRETGRTLPIYSHQGEYWVAGVPGARYAIRIQNRANGRILALTSVDGINVISGDDATLDGSDGYVLKRAQRYDITGWRKSDNEIANFHFSSPRGSYAGRTGRPDNIGVIGVALYRERTYSPYSDPFDTGHDYNYLRKNAPAEERSNSNKDSASSDLKHHGHPMPPAPPAAAAEGIIADAPQARQRLGTGHGEREYAPVRSTTFTRATTRPAEVIRIRYDTYDNLVARGVIPRRSYAQPRPDPFPGNRYVPDPPRRY